MDVVQIAPANRSGRRVCVDSTWRRLRFAIGERSGALGELLFPAFGLLERFYWTQPVGRFAPNIEKPSFPPGDSLYIFLNFADTGRCPAVPRHCLNDRRLIQTTLPTTNRPQPTIKKKKNDSRRCPRRDFRRDPSAVVANTSASFPTRLSPDNGWRPIFLLPSRRLILLRPFMTTFSLASFGETCKKLQLSIQYPKRPQS
uniref:Uncharacterized protein n=1 Tax=Plectus sambesii TaxID=2011161 RepID=A0A914WX36_9BILA